MTPDRLTRPLLVAVLGGALLTATSLPLLAAENAKGEEQAAGLRKTIKNLPHLVRTTPNIYLIRVETVAPVDAEPASGAFDGAGGDEALPAFSTVTATVMKTLKGRRALKLSLTVRQRPPVTDPGANLEKLQTSPMFLSPERFLSPRNPLYAWPWFEKDRIYLVFLDKEGETLTGGPYGRQRVGSEDAFWVRTVKNLVQNPNSSHAVKMSVSEFIAKHRSAFVMLIADCLGTEVVISEPLFGAAVRREEIDPAWVHPRSAADCAGKMDMKRGLLGLIEAEPWFYQLRRGYPNQSYVEIRDGMLDFSELGLDILFPDNGKIAVDDLAERMSKGGKGASR